MLETLAQMAAFILLGVIWRIVSPGGLGANATRAALTGLVYYVFLPALVLLVLWQAPLVVSSIKVAIVAATGVLVSLLAIAALCAMCNLSAASRGAVMLAAAFPNVTYLGLPVLEATLGKTARSIAIGYDLFACTPLLFTVGIWIAARYGANPDNKMKWYGLFQVPAVWAAIVAAILNIFEVPIPDALLAWLQTLGNGVVPLMLISLGLSLQYTSMQGRDLYALAPVLGVQLILMPVVVLMMALLLGMKGLNLQAVVLEAAMPSMVIGVVLCDRYGLDSALYAAATSLSTAVSFISLGVWFEIIK